MNIIGIDPGLTGAVVSKTRTMHVSSPQLWVSYLQSLSEATVILEDVGYWRPGDSPTSIAKFARGCGFIEGVLFTMPNIKVVKVTPQKWMLDFKKTYMVKLEGTKTLRKREIRHIMSAKYPLCTTIAMADAFALYDYGVRNVEG